MPILSCPHRIFPLHHLDMRCSDAVLGYCCFTPQMQAASDGGMKLGKKRQDQRRHCCLLWREKSTSSKFKVPNSDVGKMTPEPKPEKWCDTLERLKPMFGQFRIEG